MRQGGDEPRIVIYAKDSDTAVQIAEPLQQVWGQWAGFRDEVLRVRVNRDGDKLLFCLRNLSLTIHARDSDTAVQIAEPLQQVGGEWAGSRDEDLRVRVDEYPH